MRDHEFNAHRVKTEKLAGYGDGITAEETVTFEGAITASEGVALAATAVSGVTTLLSPACLPQ